MLRDCDRRKTRTPVATFQMRRVTASAQTLPRCEVSWTENIGKLPPQPALGRSGSQTAARQRFVGDPVVPKSVDKRLGIEIASMQRSLWRRQGQGIGIPIVQDERPAHPTDIVKWIDTEVIVNSLTKDDASYHYSSQIWIRTSGTFKKPNPKY